MVIPKVDKKPHEFVEHGFKRNDPFYWLRDKSDQNVISYLEAENEYTKLALNDTTDFQQDLYDEMKGRIKEDDSSVPFFKNGYWYYTRYTKGGEHAIYCRKKAVLTAKEEIVLDENELAKPYAYYEIESFSVSPDNQWVAYAEDINGRRQYRVKIKNLETGELLLDELNSTGGDLAWENDSVHFYFSVKDKETLRPYQIKKHRINTPEDNDEIVFTEKDEAYITGVSKERNGRFIFIGSWSTLTTEYRILDLQSEQKEFEIFHPRTLKLEYYPESSDDGFYIKHNLKAKNFMLSYCSFDNRSIDQWQTIQAHDKSVLIEDFEVFKSYLVVQQKSNGLSQLKVFNLVTNESELIPPKEETFMLDLDQNPNFDVNSVRIRYSSLTTPTSIIDIDLSDFTETLKKQQTVLGPFSTDDYGSERIWATGNDGVKVPVSLVYRKELFKKDGTNPVLLYGYGSYGATIDPYFSSVRLSLLDRGFVFAIAHIRGSEYLGTEWYESGKFLKKKNTFTDFISCAEALISQNYASKKPGVCNGRKCRRIADGSSCKHATGFMGRHSIKCAFC